MEADALTFTHLQGALDAFIDDFVKTYKDLLKRDNKKATGNLIDSVKPLELEFSNNKYTGSISLASYWKFVEYGRRKGGKFPPFNKILEWVKVKPVLPREINGIKPTQKQLTFLICRKIARDGIEAGNQYKEALDLVWAKNNKLISDAITQDLNEAITLIRL